MYLLLYGYGSEWRESYFFFFFKDKLKNSTIFLLVWLGIDKGSLPCYSVGFVWRPQVILHDTSKGLTMFLTAAKRNYNFWQAVKLKCQMVKGHKRYRKGMGSGISCFRMTCNESWLGFRNKTEGCVAPYNFCIISPEKDVHSKNFP